MRIINGTKNPFLVQNLSLVWVWLSICSGTRVFDFVATKDIRNLKQIYNWNVWSDNSFTQMHLSAQGSPLTGYKILSFKGHLLNLTINYMYFLSLSDTGWLRYGCYECLWGFIQYYDTMSLPLELLLPITGFVTCTCRWLGRWRW